MTFVISIHNSVPSHRLLKGTEGMPCANPADLPDVPLHRGGFRYGFPINRYNFEVRVQ